MEHKESIEEVVARHKTDLRSGLSSADAEARLARDGPNILSPAKRKPEWLVFIEQFISVFALLLWIGAILSFVRKLTNEKVIYINADFCSLHMVWIPKELIMYLPLL